MRNIELVQYDKLKKTKKIKDPQNLDHKLLERALAFTEKVCATNGFGGISFNEIPTETFLNNGLPDWFSTANIALLRPNQFEPGKGTVTHPTLVINARIYQDRGYIASPEGCGSVGYGKIIAICARPSLYRLNAFCFNKGKNRPERRSLSAGYFQGDLTQHEIDHINGESWLSKPYLLRGIERNSRDLEEEILKVYDISEPVFRRDLERMGKPILQFDMDTDSFYLVDFNGSRIKDFP